MYLLPILLSSIALYARADDRITLERSDAGDYDIVTVKDASGNVLETVESHFAEGYEIIKPRPEDNHICLIYQFQTDGYRCYRQGPAPKEAGEDALSGITQICRGREVFMLVPVTCENDGDAYEDSLENGRQKRCTRKSVTVTYCVETGSRCIEYGGWLWKNCIKYQDYCKRYSLKIVQNTAC